MQSTTTRRGGFALVDLLTLTALTGAALTVAAVAVLAAQEAASQAKCADNLRKVGLGLHGYERDHRAIPPLGTFRPPISMLKHGWVAHALPYLDEAKLADSYRWEVDYSHPDNRSAIETRLEFLLCPSTPRTTWSISENDGWPYEAAVGDYSACNNVQKEATAIGYSPEASRQAMFSGEITPRGTRFDEVTDGLSNTMMVLEQAGKPEWFVFGERQAEPAPQPERAAWGHHSQFGLILRGHSRDGRQELGPCALNCSNNRGVYAFHPGEINVLFADASVRPLGETTSLAVLFALNTIDGGELLRREDYTP